MTNYFINVKYEEYKPETYSGFSVCVLGGGEKVFQINTGDFNFDYEMVNIFVRETIKKCPNADFYNSSSVDYFFSDRQAEIEKKNKSRDKLVQILKDNPEVKIVKTIDFNNEIQKQHSDFIRRITKFPDFNN